MKFGRDHTGRRDHWVLELGLYNFEVRYREGAADGNADVLSRIVAIVDGGATGNEQGNGDQEKV